MTGRERFNRQMHYQGVDRCFNMEFGYWDENFRQWDIFVENGISNNDEAALFFNFDPIHLYEYPWMNPPFEQRVVEETATRRVIINPDGLLAEVPSDGHDTIPHFLKSSIVTPDDWKRCKEERFRVGDPERIPDVEALRQQHPADRDYPLGLSCGSMIGKVRDLLTFEGLAYAAHDYPSMVEDMVETCCVLVESHLDHVLGQVEFDFAWGWEDICFKNGPIVSPDFFRDVVMPRYKRINRKLKAHGIDIWFTDCDGDIRRILPFFLEGGINTMFPFEVNGSGHPGELFAEYGPELRIMGGFDKMALGAGRESIDRYMKSIVPLVERGGYIPFCDHRCPPNVKVEDYLYYLDLKERVFGLKD
jgi:uroporphyrinogen decarboxylase